MKKVLSIMLVLAMLVTLFAGCGGSAAPASSAAPAAPAAPASSAAPAAPASSAAPAEKPVEKIKLDIAANTTPGGHLDQACIQMTQELNDSGLFESVYYGNSQLGAIGEVMEMILTGESVMTIGGGSDWGDVVGVPDMGVSMTPFLLDELDDIHGLTNSDLWKNMLAQAEANVDVKIFDTPHINGSRYFLTNKPVVTPADMAGLKLRCPTSSYYVNAITAFGGVPTPMPVNDMYTALSTKMVDGCEFPYSASVTRQLYEVTKYASAQPYVTCFDFWGLPAEIYNSMSDEHKAVLEKAIENGAAFSMDLCPELDVEGQKQLAEKGMTIYDMNTAAYRACMDEFYKMCGWSEEFSAELNKAMETYRASK